MKPLKISFSSAASVALWFLRSQTDLTPSPRRVFDGRFPSREGELQG